MAPGSDPDDYEHSLVARRCFVGHFVVAINVHERSCVHSTPTLCYVIERASDPNYHNV